MGFGSVSHSWEARGSLTCSHLTRRRSRWLRRALLALSCAALEGCVKWVKSNCSSYPFQGILSHISFTPVVNWNFSAGLLDFHRESLLSGRLSKLVSSRGSWTAAARNWSWFTGQCMVHTWDWCLYVYYLVAGGWVLLCLWHLVLVSEPKLSGAIAMASGIELVLNPAETMGTSLF